MLVLFLHSLLFTNYCVKVFVSFMILGIHAKQLSFPTQRDIGVPKSDFDHHKYLTNCVQDF